MSKKYITILGWLTLLGFLNQFHVLFDIVAQFRLHYAICLIVFMIIAAWSRHLIWAGVAFMLIVLNIMPVLQLYIGNPYTAYQPNMSILSANINSQNENKKDFLQYAQSIKPDVIVVQEMNSEWDKVLSPLKEDYPFHHIELREDNFGIGVFTKIKPQEMKTVYLRRGIVPSIHVQWMMNEKPLTLLATHPVPPVNTKYFTTRNNQFEDIIDDYTNLNGSFILAGDLNTTSWTYWFEQLIQRLNLKDSREGFGLQQSWPAPLRFIGITIDHVLVSRNIKVLNRRLGQDIGSDHLPVIIELKTP